MCYYNDTIALHLCSYNVAFLDKPSERVKHVSKISMQPTKNQVYFFLKSYMEIAYENIDFMC